MKNRSTLITIGMFLLFVSGCSQSESYKQPIAFNHTLHIEEAELICLECHKRVATHQKASIPNIEICQECHEDAMTESTEEEKLVAYISNNEMIPWVQVHRIPDHAYFSHRRHVTLGKIACDRCHGNVEEMTLPFTKPAVTMNMEWCLKCHEEKLVDTDCATCHR